MCLQGVLPRASTPTEGLERYHSQVCTNTATHAPASNPPARPHTFLPGSMVVRGRNSLSLSAADSGTWVITLQLARRRSMEQVGGRMVSGHMCVGKQRPVWHGGA